MDIMYADRGDLTTLSAEVRTLIEGLSTTQSLPIHKAHKRAHLETRIIDLHRLLESILEDRTEEADAARKEAETARQNWHDAVATMSTKRRDTMRNRYNRQYEIHKDIGCLNILPRETLTSENAHAQRARWLVDHLKAFAFVDLEIMDARIYGSSAWPNPFCTTDKDDPYFPPRPDSLLIPPTPMKLSAPVPASHVLTAHEQYRSIALHRLQQEFFEHPATRLGREVQSSVARECLTEYARGEVTSDDLDEEVQDRICDRLSTLLDRPLIDRMKEEWDKRTYTLELRKHIIELALKDMENTHPEWYLVLYHKYVEGCTEEEVRLLSARSGIPLTVKEYRLSRSKALRLFDELAVGLDGLYRDVYGPV